MKFKEIKNRSITELQKLLADSRQKSMELRFKSAFGQLKNVREIREIKKTISKVLFLIKQKSKEGK